MSASQELSAKPTSIFTARPREKHNVVAHGKPLDDSGGDSAECHSALAGSFASSLQLDLPVSTMKAVGSHHVTAPASRKSFHLSARAGIMFTAQSFSRVFTWRLGWFGAMAAVTVAALALGQGDTTAAGDKGLEQESVTVPPDLAWVPPDAALFLTVRPAALWNSAEGRILREQFPDMAGDLESGIHKELGLKPAEMESLTVVIPTWSFLRGGGEGEGRGFKGERQPSRTPESVPKDKAKDEQAVEVNAQAQAPQAAREGEGPDGGRQPLLFIATTTEAATLERLHKEVKAKSDARKHNDKTYYQSDESGTEVATHFVNERTMARGTVKYVLKGMERTDTETKGPLAPALRLAKDKHHLAVGLQLSDKAAANLLEEVTGGMRGVRRSLQPLFRARAAAGFADVGRDTRAEVQLFFRDGTQAKAGLDAAEDGLALLRIHVLSEAIVSLDFALDDAGGRLSEEQAMLGIQVLEQLESGLRRVRSDLSASLVRLQAQAATDLTTMLARNKETLKRRAADPTVIAAKNFRKIQNSLRQIGLALHNFHDANKDFPPAAICDKEGKPLLSWRVAILPYLEEGALYQQFKLNEPWDSEHNLKLLAQMPKVYAPVGMTTRERHTTFYRGFVADPKLGAEHQTAWETTPVANSQFGAKGTRISGFLDGTSNTILVVEAGEAVPWTKPAELPYDPRRGLPKLGGMSTDGFHILLADGSTRFAPRGFDEKTLRLLITRADGQPFGPEFDKLR
jgi:hypothetical protein